MTLIQRSNMHMVQGYCVSCLFLALFVPESSRAMDHVERRGPFPLVESSHRLVATCEKLLAADLKFLVVRMGVESVLDNDSHTETNSLNRPTRLAGENDTERFARPGL